MKDLILKYFWFFFTSIFSLFIFIITLEYQSIKESSKAYNEWDSYKELGKVYRNDISESNTINRFVLLKEYRDLLFKEKPTYNNSGLSKKNQVILNVKKKIAFYEMNSDESTFYKEFKTNHVKLLKFELKCWRQLGQCFKDKKVCQKFVDSYLDYVILVDASVKDFLKDSDEKLYSFFYSLIKIFVYLGLIYLLGYLLYRVVKFSLEIAYIGDDSKKKKRKR